MAETQSSASVPKRLVWVTLACVSLLVAVLNLPLDHWIAETGTWFKQHGLHGQLVFACAYFLAGLILLPIFPLTVFAGVVYGLYDGALVVLPAAVCSATLGGWLGRTVLEGAVLKMLNTRPVWLAVCTALSGHGLRAVVLNRMAPLLPFGVQNYGLGAVGIRPLDHCLGTLIGIQPAMWSALYIGTVVSTWAQAKQALGTSAFSGPRLYLMILGCLAIMILMFWLGRVALKAQRDLTGPR